MLLSSRPLAYAHAIKAAQTGKQMIAPQAASLGLTHETSVRTLSDLHTLYIADGMPAVGRKLIVDAPSAAADSTDRSCLGYVYRAEFPDEEGELPVVRTHGSTRLRLEPKLILRFAAAPDLTAGFGAFINAIDAIAIGAEVLLLPFAESSWRFEDKVCANGFSKTLMVGELRTLSQSRKKNFSQLLEHSTFSLSRRSAAGASLVDYTPGQSTTLSSIAALYRLLQQEWLSVPGGPIVEGDLVALNAIARPQAVAAGDEWICVSTGLDLESLRIRFSK